MVDDGLHRRGRRRHPEGDLVRVVDPIGARSAEVGYRECLIPRRQERAEDGAPAAAADELLFRAGDRVAIDAACRQAPFGKLTPEALYVHVSAITRLPPLLRVYEGCARVLTGAVEGATIVKLNRLEPKVSYLVYPSFDAEPHPALAMSVRADLRRLDVRIRDFRASQNPPILHRKELFVLEDYPGRDQFAALSIAEEQAGLFRDSAAIGTRAGWQRVLAAHGLRVVGHRLLGTRSE